jgi:O-antigen/teichoic acid export membrane protein
MASVLTPDGLRTMAGFARAAAATRAASGTPVHAQLDAVLRGGAVLFALQVANVATAYVAQVLLARWLGGVQFGVYAYAWAWANLLAVPAGLGLATGVHRFVPGYAASDDAPRLRGFVRWSGGAVFAAGAAIGALCAAVGFALRDAVPLPYLLPLWIAFATVPLLALSTLHINEGTALGRPAAAYLPWVLGSNIGVVAAAALLLRSGAQLDAAATLVLALGVLAVIVLAQARAVSRMLGSHQRTRTEPREWLRVSAPLLASSLLYVLLERSDLVLVGTLLGPREAGIYGAAARTALLASFSAIAVTTLATPRIAVLHERQTREELQAFAASVGRWTFWPALGAALVIIALGGPILSLFGAGFRDGWACLAVLAAAQVAPASVGLAPHLLNMTGHERASAAAMGVAVVIGIGLGLILIPRMGALGAALGTSCAMIARAAGHALLVRRRLGLHTFAPLQGSARSS